MKNPNGSGSFRKLPDGRWAMRKMVGFKSDGKPKILSVTSTSKSSCIKLMKVKESEWLSSTGLASDIKTCSLSQLCRRHLDYDITAKRLKPKSNNRRDGTIRNQIENAAIGSMQVFSITATDVMDYFRALCTTDLSASSIQKAYDEINSALKWAVKRGILARNVCEDVHDDIQSSIKKIEEIEKENGKDIIALSSGQINKLEMVCRIRNKNNGKYKYHFSLAALLLLYTGMRAGEACSLKWEDYFRNNGKPLLRIDSSRSVSYEIIDGKRKYSAKEENTKNYKSRTIELSDKAAEILDEIKSLTSANSDDDYIILTTTSTPISSAEMGDRMNTLFRAAGFPEKISGAHVLRKTFATQKAREGKSIDDIAKYIGDTPETVRNHYVCLTETEETINGLVKYVPLL